MNDQLAFSLEATHAGGAIETVTVKPFLTERRGYAKLFPWSAVTDRSGGTALDEPEHHAIVRAVFPLQIIHPKRCGATASHRTPMATTTKPTPAEWRYSTVFVAVARDRQRRVDRSHSSKL